MKSVELSGSRSRGKRLVLAVTWALAMTGVPIHAAGAAGTSSGQSPLVATPTAAQSQGLDAALGTAPAVLRADVSAALPTLRPFLMTLMCVQDERSTQSLVQKFIGPRGTNIFAGWAGANSPAKRLRHHDMVGCLSVTRAQNWHRNALNEFAFDIIFTADDSGESVTWPNVVHREPDGTWLIG